jgi:hypothetical protein
LSGLINGTSSELGFGVNLKTLRPMTVKHDGWKHGTLWNCTNKIMMYLIFAQNFSLALWYLKPPGTVSADREHEIRYKTVKTGKKIVRKSDGESIDEVLYEMCSQSLLLMDLNFETFGMNR